MPSETTFILNKFSIQRQWGELRSCLPILPWPSGNCFSLPVRLTWVVPTFLEEAMLHANRLTLLHCCPATEWIYSYAGLTTSSLWVTPPLPDHILHLKVISFLRPQNISCHIAPAGISSYRPELTQIQSDCDYSHSHTAHTMSWPRRSHSICFTPLPFPSFLTFQSQDLV